MSRDIFSWHPHSFIPTPPYTILRYTPHGHGLPREHGVPRSEEVMLKQLYGAVSCIHVETWCTCVWKSMLVCDKMTLNIVYDYVFQLRAVEIFLVGPRVIRAGTGSLRCHQLTTISCTKINYIEFLKLNSAHWAGPIQSPYEVNWYARLWLPMRSIESAPHVSGGYYRHTCRFINS